MGIQSPIYSRGFHLTKPLAPKESQDLAGRHLWAPVESVLGWYQGWTLSLSILQAGKVSQGLVETVKIGREGRS